MFCPKCGAKNPDDAKFCGSCGAALPTASSEAKADPPPGSAAHAGQAVPEQGGGAARPPAGTPAQAGGHTHSSSTRSTSGDVSNELKIGIAIASVIIPLIGIIMGAIYMNNPNPSRKAAGKLWLLVGGGMTALYCLFALVGGY